MQVVVIEEFSVVVMCASSFYKTYERIFLQVLPDAISFIITVDLYFGPAISMSWKEHKLSDFISPVKFTGVVTTAKSTRPAFRALTA